MDEAKKAGIHRLLTDPRSSLSARADGFEVLERSEEPGKGKVTWCTISSGSDVALALQAAGRDQEFVVVQCADWKVIPLENLVAEFRRRGKKLYAYASSKDDIETALTVLELGADGVVIPASSVREAQALVKGENPSISMTRAAVSRIQDAGLGDRACVDTTTQLSPGEGLLVGSRASFFFLVHGETIPSQYIAARPFRVNAGAIHSYMLASDGKTRYLSELEPPDPVTLVDGQGNARPAAVGRVKIERRPLIMVEAKTQDATGSVILQKAETIRLLRPDMSPVSVTDLKVGDEVIVHAEQAKARHFGGEVDEYILEK